MYLWVVCCTCWAQPAGCIILKGRGATIPLGTIHCPLVVIVVYWYYRSTYTLLAPNVNIHVDSLKTIVYDSHRIRVHCWLLLTVVLGQVTHSSSVPLSQDWITRMHQSAHQEVSECVLYPRSCPPDHSKVLLKISWSHDYYVPISLTAVLPEIYDKLQWQTEECTTTIGRSTPPWTMDKPWAARNYS